MRSVTPTDLDAVVSRLAAFDPTGLPVVSLYLNTGPDHRGRASFDLFLKNELRARGDSFSSPSPQRQSFERDWERINAYLAANLQPSANGVALFASAGAGDFFEAVQLDAPIHQHELVIAEQPHVYPLLRLMDEYPPYAVLVADTNAARLFVFGRGTTLRTESVTGTRTRWHSMGGWSQMRYQRHIENYHLHHAKEVAQALERVVREDRVEQIVLAGDKVIIPLLREQLPPHIAERIVDIVRLEITAPERAILETTTEALRRHDAKTDAQQVQEVLDQYRAGQLGVVGTKKTLAALRLGQVDTLLISASADLVDDDGEGNAADRLVRLARETAANISFIQDPSLLAAVGGVGARLRYRLSEERSTAP